MGRGRKSKYETNVEPYLDKIKDWKRNGATDAQIAEQLDISLDSFYTYQKEHVEFSDAVKKSRGEFVNELKGNLAELARKHTLTTAKTYTKKDPNNQIVYTYTETTVKEIDADVAAIQILLKNLDRDNWADNPQSLELKKQELELKKMLAEANNFDL